MSLKYVQKSGGCTALQRLRAINSYRTFFKLTTVGVALRKLRAGHYYPGTMYLVGVPEHPHPSPSIGNLIFKRRQIAGSLIGGIKETQEMLDFFAKHHVLAEIEVIPIQKINEAYERMLKSDVKYRFVIDNASLKTQTKNKNS